MLTVSALRPILAAERDELTGERRTRVERASADAATRMARAWIGRSRDASTDPTLDVRHDRWAFLGWVPVLIAVVGVSVLPVASMDLSMRLVVATALAAATAVLLIPAGIASLASRRVDDTGSVQLAAAGCLVIIAAVAVVLTAPEWTAGIGGTADPGQSTGLLAGFAVLSAVVALAVSIPTAVVLSGRRRRLDAEGAREDARADAASAALHAHGIRPSTPGSAAWQAAVRRLPRRSRLSALCAAHGVGAGTVWAATGGDRFFDALEALDTRHGEDVGGTS
ncbi:hypothetical protein J2Y69_003022 [Microbacterium resistens]|uniref:Uncharacterized protein n=1 Tax=Microbacterium resistens TaxID=156977 RepID=A0ABU1SFN5_9MICO|nr:hypothetical protein [Microbacterium resistens]MDR6868406.1 hypothetical protein [Microbacterium resistens]